MTTVPVTNFNIGIVEDIPNESPLPNVILTVSDPDLVSYFPLSSS